MISRSVLRAASLFALLILVFASPAARADYEESFTYSSGSLKLTNLVGAIEIEGHSGKEFVVEVTVAGADAEAGIIDFRSTQGDRAELVIGFPTDDERTYIYPELGRRSRTSFNPGRGDHGIWDVFGRDKIEVRGSGRGMELWADVRILVPAGSELIVFNGVGEMEATNLKSHLEMNVRSGAAYARGVEGDVAIDTGSGNVEVEDVQGDLMVDTGSGHVEVITLRGQRASVDTGSGHVVMREIDVPRISVDTGSGHVEMDGIACDELEIDTGSGHVELGDLAARSTSVDTGSGRVRVELTEMGDGEFDVDTGSGSITFLMPENASARVEAETNSGGIDVDVAGADIERQKRDHVRLTVGSGAADVRLEAGSGGIRIASR